MKKLTHLSLFSGIGGIDLAAEWAGFTTVGQCEWADYPTKVLEKHWPDVPRWKDIRTLTGDSFYERTDLRTVDIISGGFPCQPFSVAGKRKGTRDDRYLWPEMVRVIKELRPTWIVGENVAGIVKMALPDILSELEACGYRTRTFLIPACAVGARHRRYRVAIVGRAEYNGLSSAATLSGGAETAGRRQQEEQDMSCEFAGASIFEDSCHVANAQSSGLQRNRSNGKQVSRTRLEEGKPERSGDVRNTAGKRLSDGTSLSMGGHGTSKPESERPSGNVSDADRGEALRWESCKRASGEDAGKGGDNRAGKKEYAERQRRSTQPGMGRVADGISCWMDGDLDFTIYHYWDEEPEIPRIATGIKDRVGRLKALGNAVVPQQFYPIFKAIADIDRGSDTD